MEIVWNNEILPLPFLFSDGDDTSHDLLHDSLCKLLPTLNGLVFAVDFLQPLGENSAIRVELEIMASQINHLPLLILLCSDDDDTFANFDFNQFATTFHLRKSNRPWGAFKVNTSTMQGLDQALTWMLYHCQKSKESLRYHTQSASNAGK